jgi:uncharacterized glyoxalase superfamily metalloenzyme YdcJ
VNREYLAAAPGAGLAADGLAYYRQGDPTQPIVDEDFLPRSRGIFRSNLDSDAVAWAIRPTPATTWTG